jgi:streptogrisin C
MNRRRSRLVGGGPRSVVVLVAAVAVVVTGATVPATAQTPQAEPDRGPDTGRAALVEAMVADLGLSPAEAEELIDTQPAGIELSAELEAELDAGYAGSWFDQETGALTVAVTDPADAEIVTAAGAEAQVVSYSEAELEAIKEQFDELAEADDQAMDAAISWGVDVIANQVVLTVTEGSADSFAALVEPHGDAVSVVESDIRPELTNHPWLDGGIPFGVVGVVPDPLCSTGFNTRNLSTGVGYVLTAGHCIASNRTARSHGINIGPAVASFFPTFDDALIRNDNPGSWIQGPWIWTYPGFITVAGWTDPPVNTTICKSGMTTGVTCGVITQKNETVTFSGGQTVYWLTRHTACVEGGDSGGPNWTSTGRLGTGTTTGAQLINGRCLQNFGLQNVSWYFPLTVSLPYYQSAYGVSLLTG